MRLISCYIENFGGLSHYRLDFQSGITIVQEENGFGKTTLAEFIRAMFYGFPRAVKTMDKNPRKKYTPWNGGTYGGYLVFEHNGKRYRIDRKFGATPKGDTFALTDAETHKKSIDFTANIGVELFELDAESFERSTYMPQVHDRATIATTGIQSKLGDLVHDTNDINNYDKAIKALKEKRSAYIPFRGKGGSVADAVGKITNLQEQIDLAESKRPQLMELLEKLEELSDAKSSKSGARETIRKEIQQRSQYDAKKSAEKQLQNIVNRKLQLENQQKTLLSKYQKGLPSMNEVKRIERIIGKIPSLMPQPETQTDLDAQSVVAKMDSYFASGIPDSTLFSDLRNLDKKLIETESAIKTAVLTDQELSQLNQLDNFFLPGIPDEGAIDRCQSSIRERASSQERLNNLSMEETDRLQLDHLKVFFANGLPEEANLNTQQDNLIQINAYRQENLRISAAVEEQYRNIPEPEPAPKKPMLLPMILGIVLACLGIAFVVFSYLVPGMILMALGVMLFATGFALKLKQDVANELRSPSLSGPVIGEDEMAIIRSNSQKIDQLEQQITAFTTRYISDGLPLQEKVSTIRTNRERYLYLKQRQGALTKEAEQLEGRFAELTSELSAFLKPYFGTDTNFENQLRLLQIRIAQYRDLSQKRDQYNVHSVELCNTRASLWEKMNTALRPYSYLSVTNGYTAAIAQLEKDSQRYASAVAHLSEQQYLRTARDKERKKLVDELQTFSEKYAIEADLSNSESFHQLRDDVQRNPQLLREVAQAAEDIQSFQMEHNKILAISIREDLRDPEILKLTESHLTDELQNLEQELASLEQRRRVLNNQIDAIPRLQDEIDQWQEARQNDIRNSAMLDQTISFLEQARESLSIKYMGTVQHKFISYMNRISGEDRDRIFVTPELEVTIERLGEPRSLDYFSAGQTDIVTLCMRLALVDALFKDTSSFIILDDPFVNLDDHNMKQALGVLQELAQDHQIVYLVCNSSRTF